MLFNVEHDFGDRIIGYLVPDAFSAIGRVRICRSGEQILVLEPPEALEALVQAGRHETGLCGFTINEDIVPGLAGIHDLEIYDDDTGCLIYRRFQPGMIQKKAIRFETHLFPLRRFDEFLRPSFQYFSHGIDRYGRETVTQMLLLKDIESLFLSGRINYKNFNFYIENGFECCTLIQEPRDEIAERLLILRHIRRIGTQHLGDRDATRLIPAMEFAESLPLEDEKALRWAFLEMPTEVSALLSNPVVRQLTTANPDDMPNNAAIATALDVLSTFTIVGIRDQSADFALGLGEWLGLDGRLLPEIPSFGSVSPLGEFLRKTNAVDVILEKDIELYYHILQARNGLGTGSSVAPTVIDGQAN